MPLLTRPTTPRRSAGLVTAVTGRLTPFHVALGRSGAGTAMLVRPRLMPQLLGVDSATSARVAWSVQMLGARELALGLGTMIALRSPQRHGSRLWVAGGLLSDAVDALAVSGALAKGRVSKGGGLAAVGVALGAVAIGARALQEDEGDT